MSLPFTDCPCCLDRIQKQKEHNRNYYARNSEDRKDYVKEWRKLNPEKPRQYSKTYYEKNKEKILARKKVRDAKKRMEKGSYE